MEVIIIGRIFASEIWAAYLWRCLLSEFYAISLIQATMCHCEALWDPAILSHEKPVYRIIFHKKMLGELESIRSMIIVGNPYIYSPRPDSWKASIVNLG